MADVIEADAVILGTGYRHAWPAWFEALKQTTLATDEDGHAIIGDDFSALRRDGGKGRIFVQNAEIFQHGVGAPDLGLGAYRNAMIVNQLLQRDHYKRPREAAFQSFELAGQRARTGALTSA